MEPLLETCCIPAMNCVTSEFVLSRHYGFTPLPSPVAEAPTTTAAIPPSPSTAVQIIRAVWPDDLRNVHLTLSVVVIRQT